MESLDDGYHIALLILVNLYRLCPQFLRENRVIWLRAPLYIEHDKKNNAIGCYYTDEELAAAANKIKGTIIRNKGLGSMSDLDVAVTMFSPVNQHIDEIEYSEEGIKTLAELMGEEIKPRKDFVFSQIDFSKYNSN